MLLEARRKYMNEYQLRAGDTDALITEFFEQDDIKQLAQDAGNLLGCPLLVLDDSFRVAAHYCPVGFSDSLFKNAVECGEITYEAGALISKSSALREGNADFIKPEESPYRRRFAPLICTGVRLGYLICVDTDGHLQKISAEVWRKIDMILAKQLFIETSRQDKPFETAEEILMHLLDGGFPSASYFRLQAAGTYLADFHPSSFALINLAVYNSRYAGNRQLREEIEINFPKSHPFLYRGDVFLFLHENRDLDTFSEIAEEFGLKVVISEPVHDLFELPSLYRAAHDALDMISEGTFHGGRICSVARLRTPLLLKNLENRNDLICQEIHRLAEYDSKKDTQYCETLYFYLVCNRSLKKTCEMLFTHRNTVLYRISRMRDEFLIPIDDASRHTELLLGAAVVMLREKGADFFLRPYPSTDD